MEDGFCSSPALESDAREEKNSYTLQGASDKPEGGYRLESCALELAAFNSQSSEAAV